MNKNIYEVFEEFEKATSKAEKIKVLQKNNTPALRAVLKGSFDPKVEYVVEKVPYYSPSDAPPGLGYSSIPQEITRSYLFEKNNPRVAPNLTQERKEQILIQILESLEKREAEVFMNMLLKKQKVKGLTANIIKEALPNVL